MNLESLRGLGDRYVWGAKTTNPFGKANGEQRPPLSRTQNDFQHSRTIIRHQSDHAKIPIHHMHTHCSESSIHMNTRRTEDVGAVGRHNHLDLPERVEPIQLVQQLHESPLNFPVAPTHTRFEIGRLKKNEKMPVIQIKKYMMKFYSNVCIHIIFGIQPRDHHKES